MMLLTSASQLQNLLMGGFVVAQKNSYLISPSERSLLFLATATVARECRLRFGIAANRVRVAISLPPPVIRR